VTDPSLQSSPLREVAMTLAVGKQVLAGGKLGVIESIAYSVATKSFLYVVAHDPRVRLTYRFNELTPLT
jgi:hypothetical protein